MSFSSRFLTVLPSDEAESAQRGRQLRIKLQSVLQVRQFSIRKLEVDKELTTIARGSADCSLQSCSRCVRALRPRLRD